MRSVSFLRLGTGRRVGERGAPFPSASESLFRPTLPLKFLAYSVTPAARWDLRALLFWRRLSGPSQNRM